ncbi:Spy/CpxP family protein refolding chaperone [Geobacter sp. SVR]|uniref:Spy/CpxP family protein refolding chaperone n=1 Tax=Geobacter sp. SVR TaxID=2495594 RepID=UPI00143EFDD6|nr:Spy/CpxP family protein refolding chaperone [Geobacter sp. SVR]BCS52022.1 hypothetical protein GSVR_03300 [Geobacter sp. SVR]GCF87164.1 hypothetical protein GSbR_37640 [Geobacter sp. SVR]
MRSVIKNLAACAAIVAAIGLSPALSHAYMGNDGPVPAPHHLKKMARDLGLSQQQQQQIKDIFSKERPQMGPLAKQLRTERGTMRSLIHGETFDEAAIRAQSAKVAAIQADLAVERARIAQEIRKVLTPDQVQKFKELQAKQVPKHDRKQWGRGNCADAPQGQGK